MSRCADSNCGYYWLEQGELYPRCHYPDDGSMAPCEYDDEPVDTADYDEDIQSSSFWRAVD